MITYNTQANVAITRSANGGFVITVMKKATIPDAVAGIALPQYSPQESEVYTASGIDDAVNIVREILSGLQT